jgi:uncharacterized Zn-finger protein
MICHVRSHCQLARELGLAQKSMEMKIKNQKIKAKSKSEAQASSKGSILSVPPSFECCECKDKFSSITNLTYHMLSHGTAVKCEICSAGYRHAMGLALHKKRMHFQECKMLKCDLCDRVFERQPALNDHKKYVHGTRLKKTKQCRRKKSKKIESDPLAMTAKLEDDLVREQSDGGDGKKFIKSEVMLPEMDASNDKPEEIILELKEEIHDIPPDETDIVIHDGVEFNDDDNQF